MYEFWWINIHIGCQSTVVGHSPVRQINYMKRVPILLRTIIITYTEKHTINGVTSGVEVVNTGQRVETREERAENKHYFEVSIKIHFSSTNFSSGSFLLDNASNINSRIQRRDIHIMKHLGHPYLWSRYMLYVRVHRLFSLEYLQYLTSVAPFHTRYDV